MTAQTPQPLIWINGFPGTGKLTVAKILTTLHGGSILLHNHMLIDPVEAQFPRDHPEYQKQRQLYRQLMFKEYVSEVSKLSQLIIFTDFQSDNELGRSVALEYKDAAQKAGRPFKPIYLTCDADENVKRVVSLDRINSGTRKLTDVRLLEDFRAKFRIFRFDHCPGFEIDTTNITPQEAAVRILAFVNEDVEGASTARTLTLKGDVEASN